MTVKDRFGIVKNLLLANILFALVLLSVILMSHAQQISYAWQKADNRSLVLERTLSSIVSQISLLLVSFEDEIEGELSRGGIRQAFVNDRIQKLVESVPGLAAVRYSNAAGQVAAGAGYPFSSGAIQISDRDYFQQLKHHPETMLVSSKPVFGRTLEKWVIVFARAIHDSRGNFNGVVFASVELSRFGDMFESFKLGTGAEIIFLDGNFSILSYFPYASNLLGRDISQKELRKKLSANLEHFSLTAPSPSDGAERLYCARKLASGNYWVVVGLNAGEELSEWRSQVRLGIGVWILFLVLTGTAGVKEYRNVQHQQNLLKLLESTLEASSNGIIILGSNGSLLHANRLFFRMWGCPDCESAEVFQGKDRMNFLERMHSVNNYLIPSKELFPQNSIGDSVDTVELGDGRIFERSSRQIILNDIVLGNVWSFTDITERTQALRKLREGEERFRELIMNLNAGIVVHASDSSILMNNPRASEMLGLSEDQMRGKTAIDPEWKFVSEDNIPLKLDDYPVNRVLSTHSIIQNMVAGIYHPERRNTVWVLVNGYPIFQKDGNIKEVVISFIDITDRRMALEALRLSEEKYRRIIENGHDLIVEMDASGKFLYVSPNHLQYLGYTSEEMLKMDGFFYIYPDDVEMVKQNFAQLFERESFSKEYRVVHKNGAIRWIESFAKTYRTGDGELRCSIFSRDITEKKTAMAAYLESEEKYRRILENAHDMIGETDIDGNFLYVSPNHEQHLGYKPDDLIGKNAAEFICPDDLPMIVQNVERVKSVGTSTVEFRMRDNNGALRWVESAGRKFRTQNGDDRIVFFSRDITERKNTEQAMIEKDERLEEAQRIAHLGNWDIDLSTNHLIASDEYYRIFEIDQNKQANVREALRSLTHPEDIERVTNAFLNAHVNNEKINITYRILFPDGRIKYLHLHSALYEKNDGVLHVRGTVQDVTEREQAEEKILKSLNEKETLIRELYHRTKNTMQVVSGILGLQAANHPHNEELSSVVRNAREKIQAIALVQQMLYESNDLSRISIKAYLEELTRLIMASYAFSSDHVRLKIGVDEVPFLIDTAIPLGLIVNELMTNTLKYAFPDGRTGEISINLSNKEEKRVIFSYKDNGVGVPQNFDFRNQSSLGLKLVYRIVEKQLLGSVEMKNDSGVGCTIVFDNDLYSERV